MSKTFEYLSERQFCLIGAFIKNESIRSTITSRLSPLMFERRDCRVAFKILKEMHENGERIDDVRLAVTLHAEGHVPAPCDPSFVNEAVSQYIGPTDAEISMKRIMEWATKNRIEQIAKEMQNTDVSDVDAKISEAQEKLDEARQTMNMNDGIVHISEPMDDLIESLEENEFCSIEYPIMDLQDLTCGLKDGQYCVVGARPSVGKTSFARQIAFSTAEKGKSVLFISAEMSEQAIAQCYIQSETGISMQKMMNGFTGTEDEQKVKEASEKFQNLDLYVDPCKKTDIMSIKSRAEVKTKEEGVDLIVVDYLQVISADADSRVQEIGKITRNLKRMAHTLNVPVIVASQVNRNSDGRPKMRQLKWSGAIEQDADQVLLLHRPDKNEGDDENEAEIVVAKNRMGPTAVIDCVWLPKEMRFVDKSPQSLGGN